MKAFDFPISGLPMAQYVGARAYMLQQKMECKGGKVYDIDNVQVEGLKFDLHELEPFLGYRTV